MDIKKVAKVILLIITGIVILFAIAAFTLVELVDPNKFKPQIIAYVNNATGRQLSMPGKLSWRFYPEVGIEIGAASLSNPNGFSQPTFAEIDSANLGLSTWGLLQGQVHFDTLNLNGLHLFLIQGKTQNNWIFANNDKPSNNIKITKQENNDANYNFGIESVNINNSGISYDNYQNKSHYALSNINLSASDVSLNNVIPFPITLSANYNINQNLSGNFKITTQILYKGKANTLTLSNVGLQNSLNYPTSNNTISLSTNLSADQINANLNAETLNIPSLNFIFNQTIKGEINNIQVNNLLSNPKYTASIQSSNFSLNDFMKSLNLNALPTQNKGVLSQVSFSSNISGTENSLTLSKLSIATNNSQLNGNINISSFSPLNLAENVALNQIDVADFVDLKGARLLMQNLSSNGTINIGQSSENLFPQTLNGKINLNAQDVILKGYDVRSLINSLSNVANNLLSLKGLAQATSQVQQQIQQFSQQDINANNGKSTDLGILTAKININNGVITTPVMNLNGKDLQVNGSGNIDLTQQTLNYELDAQMLSSNNYFIKNLTIPYQIHGSFSNISQGLNWIMVQAEIIKFLTLQLGKTVQNTLTQVVQQTIKTTSEGGQDIGTSAAKALNSIFGGQ